MRCNPAKKNNPPITPHMIGRTKLKNEEAQQATSHNAPPSVGFGSCVSLARMCASTFGEEFKFMPTFIFNGKSFDVKNINIQLDKGVPYCFVITKQSGEDFIILKEDPMFLEFVKALGDWTNARSRP